MKNTKKKQSFNYMFPIKQKNYNTFKKTVIKNSSSFSISEKKHVYITVLMQYDDSC